MAPWETVASGALLAGAGALAYAVRSPRCSWFAPSIWRGDGGQRAIALTFDDGPSESTPRLLDLLEQYGAQATFFQIGRHVQRLPVIAREVAARGHEVGNHTWSHAPLSLRRPGFVWQEIYNAQQVIQASVGVTPRWFRPPYGVRWFGLRAAQRRLGLTTVMWSQIARDWRLDAVSIERRLRDAIHPGAIWCLHDGRALAPQPDVANTIEAVRRLLPVLRERGYRLVTVSGLLSTVADPSGQTI